MTRYAMKTCNHCGIRKPQPEMYRETIYVESGRSRTGVSTRTGIGFLLGEKKSTSTVTRWLFNSGQRTYQRKKEVWVCGSCGGRGANGFFTKVGVFIGYFIALSVIILVLAALTSP
jgi:hypothetical protein